MGAEKDTEKGDMDRKTKEMKHLKKTIMCFSKQKKRRNSVMHCGLCLSLIVARS